MPYYEHLLIFGIFCVAAWFVFTYFWPCLLLSAFKRAILVKGFGDGPIPINTLYMQPQEVFAEPIKLQTGPNASAVAAAVNHDTLLALGWLDLSQGPLVLHVPAMNGPDGSGPDASGRYYCIQFTDPSKNTNFAYVGKRTTGTQAGDFLITGPGWKGQAPGGMKQISSPNNAVLLIGRVLVENDGDLPAAYALLTQIQLTPTTGSN
jgi:hypothetical protein